MMIRTHGKREIGRNLADLAIRGFCLGRKNTVILIVFAALSCSLSMLATGQDSNSGSNTRHTLGPFEDPTEVQQTERLLRDKGIPFAKREQPHPGSPGIIVVSPPIESRTEVNKLLRSLRDKGINDVVYLLVGPYQGRVSVGVFSTRIGAIERQVQLARLGFVTELIERTGLKVNWLLDIDKSLLGDDVLRELEVASGDQVEINVAPEVVFEEEPVSAITDEDVYVEAPEVEPYDVAASVSPEPEHDVIGQAVSPEPEHEVIGQAVSPEPAYEVIGQTVSPEPAHEVIGQAVSPEPAHEVIDQTITPAPAAAEEPQRRERINSVTIPDQPGTINLSGNSIYYGLGGLLVIVGVIGFMLYRMKMLRQRILPPPMQALIGSALDSRVEAVLVLDSNQTIVFVNQSLENIVESSAGELSGKKAYVLKAADADGKLLGDADTPWGKALMEGVPQMNLRLVLKSASNKHSIFMTNSSPLLDDSGKPVGVLVSFNPLEELGNKNQSPDDPGIVAGDFSADHADLLARQNPDVQGSMNAILGYAEILRRGFGIESEESRKYIDAISSSSDQAVALINDIIELSRIETGNTEVEAAAFSPAFMLDDVVKLMNIKVEQQGISVVYQVEEELPTRIVSDPGKIRKILTNLIGNAVECSGEDDITVVVGIVPGSAENQSDLTFTIHGAGISLDEKEVASAFEFIEREVNAGQMKAAGLGLSIDKRLARAMGGDIQVRREPGSGIVFEAILKVRVDEDQQSMAPLALPADVTDFEDKVADAEARAKEESIARVDAEDKIKVEVKARTQAEEQARAEVEARAQAEEQARAEVEARAQAEEQARVEAEGRAQAEEQARAEVKARNDAEAKLDAEVTEKQAVQARVEEEIAARIEIETRAKAEADARVAAEEKAREESEARAAVEERFQEAQRDTLVFKTRAEKESNSKESIEAKAKADEAARTKAEATANKEVEARKAAESQLKTITKAHKTIAKARKQAEAQAELEVKTRSEAEQKTSAEFQLKIEEQASKRAEAEKRVEDEASKRAEAESRAEEQASKRAEAESRAEEQASKRAEAESRAEEQASKRAAAESKVEAEAKARADAERRAEEEASERAAAESKVEEEVKARADAERRAEEEASERATAQTKAAEADDSRSAAEQKAELALQAQLEAEERAEAETNARLEAEEKSRKDEAARIASEEKAAEERAAEEKAAEERVAEKKAAEERAAEEKAAEERAAEEKAAEEKAAEEKAAEERAAEEKAAEEKAAEEKAAEERAAEERAAEERAAEEKAAEEKAAEEKAAEEKAAEEKAAEEKAAEEKAAEEKAAEEKAAEEKAAEEKAAEEKAAEERAAEERAAEKRAAEEEAKAIEETDGEAQDESKAGIAPGVKDILEEAQKSMMQLEDKNRTAAGVEPTVSPDEAPQQEEPAPSEADQEQSKKATQGPQVDRFVTRLAKLLETMEADWEDQQLSEFPRICRWINKYGKAFGFPELAAVAGGLEEAVEQEELSKIPEKLRVIRGYYLDLESGSGRNAPDLSENEQEQELKPVAPQVDMIQGRGPGMHARGARWPIRSSLNVDNPTIQKLVRKSVSRLESQLASLDRAFESENYPAVAKLCYRLKGEADSVGLHPLIQPAKDLEELVKTSQFNRARERLAFLKDLCSRIDVEGQAEHDSDHVAEASEFQTLAGSAPIRSDRDLEDPKLHHQVEQFIIRLGSRLTELHHAAENREFATIGRMAQWILRYSRVLGFADFTQPAEELSEMADNESGDLIPDKLDELRLLFARIED